MHVAEKEKRGSDDPLVGSVPITIIMTLHDDRTIFSNGIVPPKNAAPIAIGKCFLECRESFTQTITIHFIHKNTTFHI